MDLSAVEHLSADALTVLVPAYRRLRDGVGSLVLDEVSTPVRTPAASHGPRSPRPGSRSLGGACCLARSGAHRTSRSSAAGAWCPSAAGPSQVTFVSSWQRASQAGFR